ncbi:MAG: SDR family oxidoreductase [Desulfobacterales bacterium]
MTMWPIPEGGENIVKSAVNAGRVDIVINNAGILRDKSFIKMDPENWAAVQAVHLNGAYNVTQPAFKIMREQGFGPDHHDHPRLPGFTAISARPIIHPPKWRRGL